MQIAKAFFPNESKFIGVLMVFTTFAVGFLARPIGSFIFGMLGDKVGERYAVNLAIWLMAIPTTLIGFLPGYNVLGIWAPALLVLLRICQGISAGGQFSGLIAIAVDSGAQNKPFLVSLVYAISVVGCFVASLVGFLSISLVDFIDTQNSFINSLAWRLPFILSIVFFIIYIKLVPDFSVHETVNNNFKLKDIFVAQKNELILMILLSLLSGTIYYIVFTYLVTYMQLYLQLNRALSFLIMNGLLALSIVLYPLFGVLAKRYNCRVSVAKKYVIFMLVALILFALAHFNLYLGVLGAILLVIGYCAVTSFLTSLFAEIFARRYRMTACSISFNLGMTLAGFAPLCAEIFSKLSVVGLPILMALILFFMYKVLTKLALTKSYQLLIK